MNYKPTQFRCLSLIHSHKSYFEPFIYNLRSSNLLGLIRRNKADIPIQRNVRCDLWHAEGVNKDE
ncbi:hypothetical protein [Legionella sp. WA2022007384]